MFHANAFEHIGMDHKRLYPKVLPRAEPISYTPGCLAHQFKPPINKAKDYNINVHKEVPFESEEMEDMLDSLTPIYDQLRMAKFWWLLEFIPTKHRYQQDNKSWAHSKGCAYSLKNEQRHTDRLLHRFNLGGARKIPKIDDSETKVHRSVKIRMDAEGFFKDKHYQPAPKFDFTPEWVG